MQANWFDFAGVRSTTLGVRVTRYPALMRAAERSAFPTIPGRSGSLTQLEGENVYDDIVLSIQCYIEDGYDIDAVCAWLRGSGALVLGNRPDRFYAARVTNQLDMDVIITATEYRSFNAVFRCSPYRYAYPAPAALTYLPLVNMLTNPGFSDGTTGWGSTTATFTIESGFAKFIATAQLGRISQTFTSIIGHKYYATARVQAANPTNVRLRLTAGTGADSSAYTPSTAAVQLSVLVTAAATGGAVRLEDNSASGWGYVNSDNFVLIDLTATFGAGNEPTATAMDAYMADRYPASWFNGTAAGGQIVNPGTADATPFITVVGSGDIDLTIGTRTIHIDGLASSITIDTDSGEAFNGTTPLTSTVTFDAYPWTIPPGTAAISWTGTVTSVAVTRPWRYI